MNRIINLKFDGQNMRNFIAIITFVMSNGLEKMFDDMSQTSGTPFVSGMNENSTPVKEIKKKQSNLKKIN